MPATLSQYRYAVALAAHQNFGRAADACGVSQPTLSVQIQKLEDLLGVKIFDRSTKPIRTTPDGSALLVTFETLLNVEAAIHNAAAEARGQVGGEYVLGVIPTMAATVLPRVVPPFLNKYTEVSLRVEELQTRHAIKSLHDGTIDGAILAGPLSQHELATLPLAAESFVLFCGATSNITPNANGCVALQDLPFGKLMTMAEGHCLRTQTLDLCQLGAEADAVRRLHVTAGSINTLCALVRQSDSFTILPSLALDGRQPNDRIYPIEAPVPTRSIVFATHPNVPKRLIRDALFRESASVLRAALD